MDNPTSTPPPPPPTSSLPLPTAADQPATVDTKLPSLATDLNTSPALTPGASAPPQGPTVPTPAAASQPQLAAQATTTDPSSKGRKRALERNLQIDNSNYYKMRLLLKDLRPHILEILRAPDFRNCKGAFEIQEKMKLMLQLYQEMIGDTPKPEKIAKTESVSNGKTINQTTLPQTSNLQTDKVRDPMVGGSAFGWNFVTYGGTEAVYCGISKQEYRSSHPINQVEAEVDLHKTV